MATPTALETEFLQLVNGTRTQAGAKPLSFDSELQSAAAAHDAEMDQADLFSHTGPDGSTPDARIESAGYDWQGWGENIAWVTGSLSETTVQQLHTNLVNSPEHYANITNGAFENVGISLHQGTYQGQTVTFVTEDFGTPTAAERADGTGVMAATATTTTGTTTAPTTAPTTATDTTGTTVTTGTTHTAETTPTATASTPTTGTTHTSTTDTTHSGSTTTTGTESPPTDAIHTSTTDTTGATGTSHTAEATPVTTASTPTPDATHTSTADSAGTTDTTDTTQAPTATEAPAPTSTANTTTTADAGDSATTVPTQTDSGGTTDHSHWHHSWGHGHGDSFVFNTTQAGSTTSAPSQTVDATDLTNTATNSHAGDQGFHSGGCGDHADAGHGDFSISTFGHHSAGHTDFHI
ncbi:CAP domain-containing protein [Methylobacterium nigriterrae]|uniref:CAP domain-containing protein n=1 Tax=Methylobacterium nigriterrae TaxID=3127512 RepID=UPI003013E37C